VLAAAVQEGAEALVISDLPYNFTNRRLIVQLASERRLPAIYPWRGAVEIGGLMAYFFEVTDITRQLAGQLDHILKGAKPGEIPIWQPTRVPPERQPQGGEDARPHRSCVASRHRRRGNRMKTPRLALHCIAPCGG
jgi:hypothetical protein